MSTPDELIAFNLSGIEYIPDSQAIPSSSQPQIIKPLEFEDFTSEPPEHLIRRSKHVGGTYSPPTLKRVRNTDYKNQTRYKMFLKKSLTLLQGSQPPPPNK